MSVWLSGPANIRSADPIPVNEWVTVVAERSRQDGSLVVNDAEPVTGLFQHTSFAHHSALRYTFVQTYSGGTQHTLPVWLLDRLYQLFCGLPTHLNLLQTRLRRCNHLPIQSDVDRQLTVTDINRRCHRHMNNFSSSAFESHAICVRVAFIRHFMTVHTRSMTSP